MPQPPPVDRCQASSPLVEGQHEDGPQAPGHRVHQGVGDHVDGRDQGGEAEGHPGQQGQGGEEGGGGGQGAQQVQQQEERPDQVPDADQVDADIHLAGRGMSLML